MLLVGVILIGVTLNLWITLCSLVILTILILPVQEHGTSVHLFLSSMSIVFGVLVFASFGKFIARYFIIFDSVINGIICLISLSAILLLVYRNGTGF